MSSEKAKFALYTRLAGLGFTFDEARSLRRIEITLHRWAEAECNGEIQRGDSTGKPYARRSYRIPGPGNRWEETTWRIADKEAGALKRLAAIIAARNARAYVNGRCVNPVAAYQQGDPRGCALYVLTLDAYPEQEKQEWRDANPGAQWICFPFHKTADQYYTRGLAVCA